MGRASIDIETDETLRNVVGVSNPTRITGVDVVRDDDQGSTNNSERSSSSGETIDMVPTNPK